jgi:hypothetical protein
MGILNPSRVLRDVTFVEHSGFAIEGCGWLALGYLLIK